MYPNLPKLNTPLLAIIRACIHLLTSRAQTRMAEGICALEEALAILTTTHGGRHPFVQQLRLHLEQQRKTPLALLSKLSKQVQEHH